eukprot:m.805784 g.805784  ORF g.805784 m.805784 type:complete len:61 (+) comp59291_c0_seq7:206-388(+)
MSLSTSGLSLADSNPVPPRSLVSCVKCSTEINCAANETCEEQKPQRMAQERRFSENQTSQ